MREGRIPCCVPFCRRTAPDLGDGSEILCRRHYTMASKTLGRRLARLGRMMVAYHRLWERVWETAPEEERGRILGRVLKAGRAHRRTWEAIKRSATEAAAGLR